MGCNPMRIERSLIGVNLVQVNDGWVIESPTHIEPIAARLISNG
jgi:hypothetical protein